MQMNYWAVLASSVGAFVVGAVWYSPILFGKPYLALRGLDPSNASQTSTSVGVIVGEFLRWLILTFVFARLMVALGIGDLRGAVAFGATMWVAIYTALAGSVLHEGTPWRLYAIHAGDGLAKIALITAILGIWRSQ